MNIQFSDDQKKSLDKMADKLNTPIAHIFSIALSLLQTTIHELKQGNDIVVTKDGKIIKKIIGILD